MSAKRKSPPSKLPEGSELLSSDRMTDSVATLRGHADTKQDNDSSLEEHISRGPSPSPKRAEDNAFPYKMSPASETSSAIASGSEYEDFFSNDEEGGSSSPTQPHKRRRTYMPPADIRFENGFPYSPYDPTNPLFSAATPPLSLLALQNNTFTDFNYERLLANPANVMNHYNFNKNTKKHSAGFDSPDKAFNLHLNNNNTIHNNNEQSANNGRGSDHSSINTNSNKKSMDDVLKKLTSKINDSTIKEERRSHSPPSKRR